ncbi:MAG TPA: hypothetical protein PLZ36_09725, partial [Armatimonadota bacterium]|nr:hypothetical protein [Armatimonadota bacterium]
FAFAHSAIRAKDEFQLFISVPHARWLPAVRADLAAALPELTSGIPYTFAHAITRTLVLTNDPQTRALMTGVFRYDDPQIFTLDEFAAFRDAGPAERRILALNWNGDEEITPAMAVQVLPAPLRPRCAAQTPDRMGITGWQRFCRQAIAQRFEEDGGVTWVIAAPTAAYLRALAAQVRRNRFLGGPYRVELCDLSYVDKLSVGVYLATPDVDRNRLVLQQRMEEIVGGVLRSKVRSMVSTQNWGQTLQEALGQDPETDNPFRRPESLRMVNQASDSDAVLLLWVKTLSPKVTHDMTASRLTRPYPAFTEPEPKPPNPNEREYIICGQHIYPGESEDARRQSEAYRRDYRRYEEEQDRWERRKWEWQRGAEQYRVNYEFTVTARPSVALSGYLRLLDLKGPQRILWSTEVELARTGNSYALNTIPVQVIGEGRDPRQPEIRADYRDAYTWAECTRAVNGDAIYGVGQTALLDSLRDGVHRLGENALWATDLKSWNLPVKRVRQ